MCERVLVISRWRNQGGLPHFNNAYCATVIITPNEGLYAYTHLDRVLREPRTANGWFVSFVTLLYLLFLIDVTLSLSHPLSDHHIYTVQDPTMPQITPIPHVYQPAILLYTRDAVGYTIHVQLCFVSLRRPWHETTTYHIA